MAIRIGDVVRLKSGGPAMTVESRDGTDWLCRWFDSKKEIQRDSFPEASLQAVDQTDRVEFTGSDKIDWIDTSKL